ncbi:TRAF3-interacting protein 1 isoform X2 [Ischnura elegans]|uniref:TRAF3-interacting protein 1 isoform X2 n=1 Tax=Ischnura elegans TaxID=197161 RepID=UPI001ED8AB12|nr:TRAF3-interacting protein 1 isoform X2 [Ischnura elegans]
MGEEVKPAVIKKTQDTLGKFIKRPPLTEKLLRKPPFRFLHDVVTSVIRETSFLDGLFSDEEMNSENVCDKESKMAFLQKVIDVVNISCGVSLSVRPAKIVAGYEPEKTNELLQIIGRAIEKKVDSSAAVQRVLAKAKGSDQPKGKKPHHTKKEEPVSKVRKPLAEKKKAPKEGGGEIQPGSGSSKVGEREKAPKAGGGDEGKQQKEQPGRRLSKVGEKALKPGGGEEGKHPKVQPERGSSKGSQREKVAKEVGREESKQQKAQPGRGSSKGGEKAQKVGGGEELQKTQQEKKSSSNGKGGEKPTRDPREQPEMLSRKKTKKQPSEEGISEQVPGQSMGEGPSADVSKEAIGEEEVGSMEAVDVAEGAPLAAGGEDGLVPSEGEGEEVADGSRNVAVTKREPMRATATPPGVVGTQQRVAIATPVIRPSSTQGGRPRSARPHAPRLRSALGGLVPAEQATQEEEVPPIISSSEVTGAEEFLVEEAVQERRAGDSDGVVLTEKQGVLVTKILETKRELESGGGGDSQAGNTGDEGRHDSRAGLQSLVQAVARAAHPLGALLTLLRENVDSMRAEASRWRTLGEQLRKRLADEDKQMELELQPLSAVLLELEQRVQEEREAVSAAKGRVFRADQRICSMLDAHSSAGY